MVYRIVNHLIDIPSSFIRPTNLSTTGHNLRFLIPFCRIDVYQLLLSLRHQTVEQPSRAPRHSGHPWGIQGRTGHHSIDWGHLLLTFYLYILHWLTSQTTCIIHQIVRLCSRVGFSMYSKGRRRRSKHPLQVKDMSLQRIHNPHKTTCQSYILYPSRCSFWVTLYQLNLIDNRPFNDMC